MFDFPIYIALPIFIFWFILIWFGVMGFIRASVQIYQKLFFEEGQLMFNEETRELGIEKNGIIEIIGKVE